METEHTDEEQLRYVQEQGEEEDIYDAVAQYRKDHPEGAQMYDEAGNRTHSVAWTNEKVEAMGCTMAEKWAEEELKKMKMSTEDEKGLMSDMITPGIQIIHVDSEGKSTRIKPYTEEWYKFMEKYNNQKNSPEPVQDIYTSLEQIREDIASIIRDGELTYPQTLNKLQEIVNKLDKGIDHGSYIQSDGTK